MLVRRLKTSVWAVMLVLVGCDSTVTANRLGDVGTTSGSTDDDPPPGDPLPQIPTQPFLTSDAALPADAGVLIATDPRFGAVGDGVHDDTQALLAAITYGAVAPELTAPFLTNYVYLPPGTYLVSDTLQKILATSAMAADARGACDINAQCYASGLILVGAGADKTTVKLMDDAPGFADPTQPKAVIFTSSSLFDASPNKDHAGKGEGNDAYSNFVESLTVDVGVGNPGAIGVDYLANNGGAMRNVLLRAPPGSGATGISVVRKWSGPTLIENVWVEGFDIGLDIAQSTYTTTLEHIRLTGQRSIGLRNSSHPVSINDLEIDDAPMPITVAGADALTVIASATITSSTARDSDAFVNAGVAHLRNVTVSGYSEFLGAAAPTSLVDGAYIANERIAAASASWSLPSADPPAVDATAIATDATVNDPTAWANVRTYGALGDGDHDDSDAISAALAAAPVVYFPPGRYMVDANIPVPASVRLIKGFMSALTPCGANNVACNGGTTNRADTFSRTSGILVFAPSEAPVVVEKLNIDNDNGGPQLGLEVAGGSFPLVVRDLFNAGAGLARDANGAMTFIENYAGSQIIIAGAAAVYARQVDIEGAGTAVVNQGASLWVLGMKSEGPVTWVDTSAGGTTEVLGGLLYLVEPDSSPPPALISTDSRVLGTFAEAAFVEGASYTVYLESTKAGITTTTPTTGLPVRDFAHMEPVVSTDP